MSEKTHNADFDAIIIGAGFAGLYMLHRLRDLVGLRVRLVDKAGGVGGTWYWNRYPGAMSDTESHIYRYSFDKEMLQEDHWDNRYLMQPEILAYLQRFAERYDLYRDIQFDTAVESAHYDEDTDTWTLGLADGSTMTSKYLVTAVGLLSRINKPDIPGVDTFAGDLVHTGAWPADLDITGKRVGVIGTGSTGCQVIVASAPKVAHLTVFQRSAQYSIPSGNGPVTEDEIAETKKQFDEIWDQVRNSQVAFGFEESTVPAMSVSEEERRRVFQENWDRGNGFRFMFGTFCDLVTDEDANKAAADFIRSKIAEIVKDPETARRLTPTDLYAKRPLCNAGYYEVYNRDNVTLVDIKENGIKEITPKGVITEDGTLHELDVLVLATGFEGVDGSYIRIDLRGRNGQAIKDHWADGPQSYLGILTAGFPNMFMVLGPNGPFTNLIPSIETQVEWISDLIAHSEASGAASVEVRPEVEQKWTQMCAEMAEGTLFPKAQSWIFAANIPGKKHSVMFYFGGLKEYRRELGEAKQDGYAPLAFQPQKVLA
ncbi:cyclohexanone monooxygenase [Gordonia paraffinivorans]|uniref:flavin-containing monooxygenase n=1 Tax=Gordonia paraffinivorans TaxID=175628 RepID=UPI000D6187A5|nr:NAD(P)/FAD-dependent oxidoreductase [Gordonia paraffinivorans]PWD42106.1 cyclohexanone monooxygenase [Gordonia paraffinivorans]